MGFSVLVCSVDKELVFLQSVTRFLWFLFACVFVCVVGPFPLGAKERLCYFIIPLPWPSI